MAKRKPAVSMELAKGRTLMGVRIIPAGGLGAVDMVVLLYQRLALVSGRSLQLMEMEHVLRVDFEKLGDVNGITTFDTLVDVGGMIHKGLIAACERVVEAREKEREAAREQDKDAAG